MTENSLRCCTTLLQPTPHPAHPAHPAHPRYALFFLAAACPPAPAPAPMLDGCYGYSSYPSALFGLLHCRVLTTSFREPTRPLHPCRIPFLCRPFSRNGRVAPLCLRAPSPPIVQRRQCSMSVLEPRTRHRQQGTGEQSLSGRKDQAKLPLQGSHPNSVLLHVPTFACLLSRGMFQVLNLM